MTTILYFLDLLIACYCYGTLAYLIGALFVPFLKERSKLFLNLSNSIGLVALCINLFLVGVSAITCQGSSFHDSSSSSHEFLDDISENCFAPFVWTLILAFCYQLLFFGRRLRANALISLGSVLLVASWLNRERIPLFIYSFYRNYQPSSWHVSESNSSEEIKILVIILYFLVCLFLSGIKRQKSLDN